MTRFLIQTTNFHIEHDFSFHLRKAVEFWRAFRNFKDYIVLLNDSPCIAGCVPIGSLKFVAEYLKVHHNITSLKFTGIPEELRNDRYLKRELYIKSRDDIHITDQVFVKSATGYKKFTGIVCVGRRLAYPDVKDIPDDLYYVSPVVEIRSEWRAFVFARRLVGLQNYAGDFTVFPDVELVKEMVDSYKDCPGAYTLDVGINRDGTFLIEVHPFVSCGLYGFADYNLLPSMFVAGFNYLLGR